MEITEYISMRGSLSPVHNQCIYRELLRLKELWPQEDYYIVCNDSSRYG